MCTFFMKPTLGFLGLTIPAGILLAILIVAIFIIILYFCCQQIRCFQRILEFWAKPAEFCCDRDSSNQDDSGGTPIRASRKNRSQKYSKRRDFFKNKSLSKLENDPVCFICFSS